MRADVRSLSVGLGEVVGFKEEFYQVFIACFFRVVFYFGGFEVSGVFTAYLLVGGMIYVPAHVTYGGVFHSFGFHKVVFGSPEASGGKVCFFHRRFFFLNVAAVRCVCQEKDSG